jgi:mevalonate kinase
VVYGRLSLTAAVSFYATASVKETEGKQLRFEFPVISTETEQLEIETFADLHEAYISKESVDKFIESQHGRIKDSILPYAVISSRLCVQYGADLSGKTIRIDSDIPLKKGYASSAASSLAFTCALLKSCNIKQDSNTIIDIARDGERILHRNPNAGGMDVSASYHGGCTTYRSSTGANSEKIERGLPDLVLIDTGPKLPTYETVGKVAQFYKNDPELANRIMDEIEACSSRGLAALKEHDIVTLGTAMNEDQRLLKQLGVSSKSLDDVISLALDAGAAGAKLSGGGGGGMAIAVALDSDRLVSKLIASGFNVNKANISISGAKHSL